MPRWRTSVDPHFGQRLTPSASDSLTVSMSGPGLRLGAGGRELLLERQRRAVEDGGVRVARRRASPWASWASWATQRPSALAFAAS